jgi:hypothetical protein
MKKISTMQAFSNEILKEQKLLILNHPQTCQREQSISSD